jgi:hypothetical protein
MLQENSEFITAKNVILKFYNRGNDKSNVIGSLLSTKTFDFKSVTDRGQTMLIFALFDKIKITSEFLE